MATDERTAEYLASHLSEHAPWRNGDTIELASIKDYHEFEEDLIRYVPHPNRVIPEWESRLPAERFIRPSNFLGRIYDVSLVFVREPHEYLQRQQFGSLANKLADTVDHAGSAFGFAMDAHLFTSKGGNIGSLSVFLAYAHPSVVQNKRQGPVFSDPKSSTDNAGIRRIISKPRIDTTTPIDELRQQSINTAYELQKMGVKRPLLGAFESRRYYKKSKKH